MVVQVRSRGSGSVEGTVGADIPFHVALPAACSWSAWAKNALVRLSEEICHGMHATGTLLNEWPAPVCCAWCLSANTLS